MSKKGRKPSRTYDQVAGSPASATPHDYVDNTALQLQSEDKQRKSSLFRRLPDFFKPNSNTISINSNQTYREPTWKAFHPTNVGLHLTQDPHPETNVKHRLLPEEHRAAHEQAKKMAQVLQEQLALPPQPLRGPVPRNRVTSDNRAALNVDRYVSEFPLDIDLSFLAPVERDVLHLLRRTSRSSYFRPLMEPTEEILLVEAKDTGIIRTIQDIIRPLPEKEKLTLAEDLYKFLTAEKNYMLKLLLYKPEIRVTSNSRGQRLGMEKAEEPKARRDSAAQSLGSGSKHTGDVRFQDAGGAKFNRKQTFEVTSERISSLRGGGDDEKSVRSLSTYATSIGGSQYGRLENAQRVPKGMWWLAGGRGSWKGKQPTAGEMRERRKAEAENRTQVGFLGTLIGRRAKHKRTGVEEYKPADGQQGTTPLQADASPVMSGALPSTPPPAVLELDKSLPPTPHAKTPPPNEIEPEHTVDAERSRAGSVASQPSNSEQHASNEPTAREAPTDEIGDRETNPDVETPATEQGK